MGKTNPGSVLLPLAAWSVHPPQSPLLETDQFRGTRCVVPQPDPPAAPRLLVSPGGPGPLGLETFPQFTHKPGEAERLTLPDGGESSDQWKLELGYPKCPCRFRWAVGQP